MQNIFFLVERVISQNKMENCINACKKKSGAKIFRVFFFGWSLDQPKNIRFIFYHEIAITLKESKDSFSQIPVMMVSSLKYLISCI